MSVLIHHPEHETIMPIGTVYSFLLDEGADRVHPQNLADKINDALEGNGDMDRVDMKEVCEAMDALIENGFIPYRLSEGGYYEYMGSDWLRDPAMAYNFNLPDGGALDE